MGWNGYAVACGKGIDMSMWVSLWIGASAGFTAGMLVAAWLGSNKTGEKK